MRITVTLDDDVYDAAKRLSRTSGESLGKVLSTLVRRGLIFNDGGRLPTFEVSSDAPVIAVSRIQNAIDEHGIC